MDQAMPADTADCSLEQLGEDAFTAMTHTDQVYENPKNLALCCS